jgi:hypothetical protein
VGVRTKHLARFSTAIFLSVLVSLVLDGTSASAQALNWEGQTGVFVTPLAYTVPSSDRSFGRPVVAYHYLNGGQVLGGFNNFTVTMGAFRRLEFGYTRTVHQEGSTPSLSSFWGSGYNAFQGKFNFLKENAANKGWIPAVSIGFVARTQIPNVIGAPPNKSTNNADFYAVATKTVTNIPKLPLVLNFGYKETNGSLFGIAGNSPAWVARAFGTFAFSLKGPARSTLMPAVEFAQQPRNIEGLPGAVVPTTLTYAIRIVPAGMSPSQHHGWGEQSPRLNIDIGVAQAAGRIMPGVNLQARHQFALGISYGF